jgi:hypothetical protein
MGFTGYQNAFDIYSRGLSRGGMTSPSVSLRSEDAFSLINGKESIQKALASSQIEKFADVSPPPEQVKEQIEPVMKCDSILNHIQSCKYCSKFLGQSKRALEIPKNIMKAIIYIMSCIFILLLLDIFVRIGQLIK